jgi:DNA-binding NtrC family response regulator
MPDLQGGTTVLIVEKDFGFAFWLAEIFNEAGCHVAPALDCKQAISITTELNLRIDLVVVSPRLRRVSDMICTLQSSNRNLKIIAIRDCHVQAIRTIPVHAILQRPSGWEPISREEWLERVQKILREVHATDVQ